MSGLILPSGTSDAVTTDEITQSLEGPPPTGGFPLFPIEFTYIAVGKISFTKFKKKMWVPNPHAGMFMLIGTAIFVIQEIIWNVDQNMYLASQQGPDDLQAPGIEERLIQGGFTKGITEAVSSLPAGQLRGKAR